MCLYPGGLKSGISIALEPKWAYIRLGLYLGFYGTKKVRNLFPVKQTKKTFSWLARSVEKIFLASKIIFVK